MGEEEKLNNVNKSIIAKGSKWHRYNCLCYDSLIITYCFAAALLNVSRFNITMIEINPRSFPCFTLYHERNWFFSLDMKIKLMSILLSKCTITNSLVLWLPNEKGLASSYSKSVDWLVDRLLLEDVICLIVRFRFLLCIKRLDNCLVDDHFKQFISHKIRLALAFSPSKFEMKLIKL